MRRSIAVALVFLYSGLVAMQPTAAAGRTAPPAAVSQALSDRGFTSIAFGDAAHGWAAGSKYQGPFFILATSDRGASWTNQPISGITALIAITAVNSTTAFALASDNTGPLLLATVDGGASWTRRSIPWMVPTGIAFVNSMNGWAFGYTYVYKGTTGLMFRTTDGGVTWTTLPEQATLSSVSFVDSNHGWAAAGNTVIATADGGVTWVTETMPSGPVPQLTAVTFRDLMHGWTVGGYNGTGVVLATTNGGATWALQATPANFTPFVGVAFASLTVGWAVADRGNLGSAWPSVASTTDGGATWAAQNTPATDELVGVAATSTTSAFLVGYGVCYEPALDATSNGGTTWTDSIVSPPRLVSLEAVTSVDTTHAWAVGKDSCDLGAVMRTTDGTNWYGLNLPAGVGDLRDVSFVDVNHGWVVGATAPNPFDIVLATTDGGASWQIQNPSFGLRGGLDRVQFVNQSTGWAVGGGFLITTTNGGSIWTQQTLPSGCFTVNDMWFADPAHGWIACSGVALFVTIDGGASWTVQTPPLGSTPAAIDFVDLNHGWTAGGDYASGGEVLGTTNGGVTWTHQTIPTAEPFNDISFSNSASGWAVGPLPQVIGTADGGTTWKAQSVPSSVTRLNGVTAASATIAWAVGVSVQSGPYGTDRAVLLKTADGGTTWSLQALTYPGLPEQAVLPALANAAYGGYTTKTEVQNIGNAPASILISYFDSNGAPVGTGDGIASLPVNATWTVRQDNGQGFATGQAGSAVIYSDQPLAGFVNEFAPGGSDATSYTLISNPSGTGSKLFAPAIANRAYGGYTTGVGLVNLAATSVDITVTYRDVTGAAIKVQSLPGVAAGAYVGLYSGDATLGLPSGFAGTATIQSSGGNLTAVVNETGPGGQFSSYDAVPSGSTTLYAPAALRNAYSGYNTGTGVQNTTGTSGTVTITYYNAAGTPTVATHAIAANGYLGVYQGLDIPADGAYTAKITSDVAIAAIVNEAAPSANPAVQQSTAYNTFAAGSLSLHLPLVESAGADGWSTGEGIMNTGASATTVTVTYYDAATGLQVGTPDSLLLQPNAFWGLYQPAGGLPNGDRASATVTTSAGGQVAVICNESNATSFMSYTGQ